MPKGTENEDWVDLDDDNYIEEMDNEVEEQIEDDEVGGCGNENDDKEKCAKLFALSPHGSEIFVGGLPRDVSEEDLRDLYESMDKILRDTSEGKSFAFVIFKTKEVAQQAIEELHNEGFKGRTLRCSLSEAKHRLFIGNVLKTWIDGEFRKVIEVTGPEAKNIELIKDLRNPSQNRGFAFGEYYNNACADYSRQKMSDTNKNPASICLVKALYVKNIPENIPTEQAKQLFQHHGEVSKVVMPPAKSGGQELEVCLAKPQSDKKFDWTNPYISDPCPNYIPHPGYGSFLGNPYGSLGARYGAATGFQQGTNAGRDTYGTNGSSKWSNWLCSSLEYRCRFHGLVEMIGATAQAKLAVAMLMTTVADAIDPTRV
ncbi:Heterogeneous nuclear ribonucleoprotein Q [Camellia lanceoleosa]|uniref:Heterogeneous nuclear ribonucleoprotein Q n=1 Tax=Camellia lanceoleosa TaxID=1840588 RepID=A0ACC0GLG6_9ERIC|nr:Heterogeneous nuclear ribonucleoprotein Q [Camellia lanceoleosa]